MPGALTLGGLAAGLLVGEVVIGPSTMTGKAQNSEVLNLELAGVDLTVKVPPEAVAFACFFTFVATSAPEVKLRTNLNAIDGGLPVPASGFMAMGLQSGVTELIFRGTAAAFQLTFI